MRSAKCTTFLRWARPLRCKKPVRRLSSLPPAYYLNLAEGYRKRRDRLVPALEEAGFQCFRPRGAYYVMTDISVFGFADDLALHEISG